METLGDVLKSVNGWQLLGLVVALGAVSMALSQLITDLTPMRSIFQAIWLRRWIGRRAAQLDRRTRESPDARWFDLMRLIEHGVGQFTEDAFSQLIAQATGGHSQAFFGLPTSQLVAQINAAAQAALENPRLNLALLAILTQSTQSWAPAIIRSDEEKERTGERIDQNIFDLAKVTNDLRSDTPEPYGSDDGPRYPPADSPAFKAYLDARARLLHRIQRNLDSMQISLANDSAWINQIFAIVIGIVIAYFIIQTEDAGGRLFWPMVLVLGIAGGYAAPLLGDVVAAIRRLGRE